MQKPFFYPLFLLLLGAALLFVSCEPTSSSVAPRQKTELEVLNELQVATNALGNAIQKEITVKRNYVANGGKEIFARRRLRRIVLFGVAELGGLLQAKMPRPPLSERTKK